MVQLEEMIRATSCVAASDYTDPRAGSYRGIMVLKKILDVVLVGSLEIKWNIRIELVVPECFAHRACF